jgi:AcrR family transcriptional regulator
MTRKITDGPFRNKERTRIKLLHSVGFILKKEGFVGLRVTNVAKKADVNRKLVYEYYGTLENLVNEYLNTRDYWKVSLMHLHDWANAHAGH